MPIPIVDSHIHLFPASHLPTLAWYTPDGPLSAQHSVDEYKHASSIASKSEAKDIRGFIFLETDRISSVAERGTENDPQPGWIHALDEVSFLTRIATGDPIPTEGHSSTDKNLCLGIVPWAPIPGGRDVVSRYMDMVKERTGPEVWKKVCGVRYLVQDKSAGVMLDAGFVDTLRWLGERGFAFDLGVDARQGGLEQLREAVKMMGRVYEGVGGDGVVIVISKSFLCLSVFLCNMECADLAIDHLCKPNLRIGVDEIGAHEEFLEWKDLIEKMASASERTFMKLSGGFSELPPLNAEVEPDIDDLVNRVQPWTDVVFDAFGAERVMFGSDWPVCNVGGGGNDVSWNRWCKVVEEILEQRGLTEEQKRGVWGGVAVRAYGIEL
jgi:L-rhamnono-1,4-lactonase